MQLKNMFVSICLSLSFKNLNEENLGELYISWCSINFKVIHIGDIQIIIAVVIHCIITIIHIIDVCIIN
jgi:hypothetical protein